jgi:two-component system sensor histidine kinase KdpD
MIFADSVMIEQVLVNLLENALRYTPAHSALEITVKEQPSAMEISVGDYGPGIPKGMENRLFEKFFRLRQEGAQSGVGLGLAICKAIIDVHGGAIRAENRPTGGAVFTFSIPLDHKPPAMEQDE